MSEQTNFSMTMRHFMPAVLRQNSNGWYIEYYAYNQITKSLERKRVKVNKERKRARTFAEFRSITSQMIIEINCKLASGWSPFCFYEGQPQYEVREVVQVPNAVSLALTCEPATPKAEPKSEVPSPLLSTMLDKYVRMKSLELTKSTMRSYTSFCNNLKAWTIMYYPNITCAEFTQRHAVEYLDYVFEGNNSNNKKQVRKKIDEEHVSPRTYNNNLKQGRAVFAWAESHCYIEKNPFEKIQTKRETTKIRTIIPPEDRQRILQYFREKNPAYEIICRMVFTSLLFSALF